MQTKTQSTISNASSFRSTGKILCAAQAVCCLVLLSACSKHGIEEHVVEKGTESVSHVESDSRKATSAPSTTEVGGEHNHDHQPDAHDSSHWRAPNGWVLDTTPKPMRLATYIIPDPDGDLELAVTRFPGRVGGDLANMNRWRGQMGLGPVSESVLEELVSRFEVEGGEGYVARVESDSGVMLACGIYEIEFDRTWFIRVTTTTEPADRVQDSIFEFAHAILHSPHGDG